MNEIEQLENWARWARDNTRSIGHCASIEHRYRHPQHWDAPEPRIVVDLFAAVRVEKIIRRLPIEQQKPLVLYWVLFRRPWRETLGEDVVHQMIRILSRRYKIGINRNSIWDRILDAQAMVRNCLTCQCGYAIVSPTVVRAAA